jgi:prepilin-type N-terminal cleavage/methylation domain-containing protein
MVSFFRKIKQRIGKNQTGVTFIELVVVISIFSIIAGTLLLNFSRFGRNITLQNLAQDIALQINSAQRQAISGLTNDLLSSCDRTAFDCSPRYGVYIAALPNQGNDIMQSLGGVSGKSLLTYFDYSGGFNEMLDTGGTCGDLVGTECLDNISLGQGNFIGDICLGADAGSCIDASTDTGVHIAFKRPFPDAYIKDDNGTRYNYARITIRSPNGDTLPKDIVITGLGKISIESHIDQ